jgi:hypothetical protein
MLPLRHYDNRVLFIRLAAHVMIGLARSEDIELLGKLASHSYRSIARVAAVRMAELMGERALQILGSDIDQAVLSHRSATLSEALRFAERRIYAVGLLQN